ncbi:hypothetical protein FACS1894170_05060 [Planctomycetales bacterium]|nr:hypothetical protein FACS1894170_05060 [Planctomycetales bacterium]
MPKWKNKILLLAIIAGIFGITPLFAEKSEICWDWKLSWFDKGDCGPNARYVLLNLCGKKVTIQEVKQRLPFDSVKGCSLEAMQKVAAELGCPIEARFVKPSVISKVPRPFIIHGITSKEQQLGHFIVVVDFDSAKRNYTYLSSLFATSYKNTAFLF